MSDDFDAPETFRPASGSAPGQVRPLLMLAAPVLVLSWLVALLVLWGLGLPFAGLWACLVAVVLTAGVLVLRTSMVRRNLASVTLVVDDRGLTYTGDFSRRFVAWSDIREVRGIRPLVGGGGLTAGTGVVGVGTLEVTGGTVVREAYRQNGGANGTDPGTGTAYVPIPLSQFEPDWGTGRIGARMLHHRPDLHGAVGALPRPDA